MKLLSRLPEKRLLPILILLIIGHSVLVQSQYGYNIALYDRCLRDHEFRTTVVPSPAECFLACVEDCLCLAFQVLHHTVCQLLSTTRFLTPSSLINVPGCLYFDVIPDEVSQTCQAEWSCCRNSNPCLNGGTCESIVPPSQTERVRCNCRPGYTGNLCQDPIKSCRGYINGSRVAGKYKVFDVNMKLFEVFCDFDTNSTMAWTLIQSYQLQNNERFRFHPFTDSFPVNEDTPRWDLYRLSKSRMESIQEDSSKWRMTCCYDTDGLSYTDYVRASNDMINILTYSGLGCSEVEFIDVRGYNCTGCTTVVAHRYVHSWSLHIESFFSATTCSFKPKNTLPCGDLGEDSFGFYRCPHSAHRCSSSPTSTSQTWFGGN